MTPLTIERVIDVFVRDRHGRSISGATIAFSVNGSQPGVVENAEGRGRLELPTRQIRVVATATYHGMEQRVDLAENQDTFTFTFDVTVGSDAMDFLERHIALVAGLLLIAVAIALAFVFGSPSTLQARIIIGTFSLAAGAIASEIPGMLNINLTLGKRLQIAAAGALAVFVLLYLFGPGQSAATSLTNVAPGATQTAGGDINNIQAGRDVNIGTSITTSQIAREFRQPVRRMVEITGEFRVFLRRADTLLSQAAEKSNWQHFSNASPRLTLGSGADDEWAKLDEVQKAKALAAELKQLGAAFPGGARMVSDTAEATADQFLSVTDSIGARFVFAPVDAAKRVYDEPEAVGLAEGREILSARLRSHEDSPASQRQIGWGRFAVNLLNALCQFHLALADNEIVALYDLREPNLLEFAKKENDAQWEIGAGVSWNVRLKFLNVYYERLQGSHPSLYAKIQGLSTKLDDPKTRDALKDEGFELPRRP